MAEDAWLPQILGPTALAITKPVTKTPDLIIFSVLQERNFGKSDFVVSEHGKWLKLHPQITLWFKSQNYPETWHVIHSNKSTDVYFHGIQWFADW